MNKALISVVALLVALAFVGCKSAPDTPAAEFVDASFKIIEHENSVLGGDIPDWTGKETGELEDDERFQGSYVFRFQRTGKDLNGVMTLTDNMDAPSEVARLVSTRVEQRFAGAEVGDQNFVETYFENVVKTVADAELNGLRKYGDFWVLRQYIEDDGSAGEKEYVYFALYVIERAQVDDLIERAIAGQSAETEEEQTARDRVREILKEGI